jgi:hypothetical protein
MARLIEHEIIYKNDDDLDETKGERKIYGTIPPSYYYLFDRSQIETIQNSGALREEYEGVTHYYSMSCFWIAIRDFLNNICVFDDVRDKKIYTVSELRKLANFTEPDNTFFDPARNRDHLLALETVMEKFNFCFAIFRPDDADRKKIRGPGIYCNKINRQIIPILNSNETHFEVITNMPIRKTAYTIEIEREYNEYKKYLTTSTLDTDEIKRSLSNFNRGYNNNYFTLPIVPRRNYKGTKRITGPELSDLDKVGLSGRDLDEFIKRTLEEIKSGETESKEATSREAEKEGREKIIRNDEVFARALEDAESRRALGRGSLGRGAFNKAERKEKRITDDELFAKALAEAEAKRIKNDEMLAKALAEAKRIKNDEILAKALEEAKRINEDEMLAKALAEAEKDGFMRGGYKYKYLKYKYKISKL